MKKQCLYISFLLLVFLSACKERPKNAAPIILGDSTYIVTEQDTNYLQNLTEDIAPTKKKSAESQITKMMVQVDSLKSSQKMEEASNADVKLNGFTINFSECSVIFDGITDHALNATQNERATHSVSYLKDAGSLLETQLEVSALTDIQVEQRLFVKLSVEKNGESVILNDLGKFTTPWYPLAGKNNRFVSVGTNSLLFEKTDAGKIKNALESALRKKKMSKDEIQSWMKEIAQTKAYTDAPCVLVPTSAQWRIMGKLDGKVVRKLVQFDTP